MDFASTFLVYWLNYNDDFLGAFNYGVRYGIQYAFDEAIHRHDIAMGDISVWGGRGYREFIERPRAASVWILRPEVARGVRSHQVSMVGTVAEYINRGQPRLKTKRGGRYVFENVPSFTGLAVRIYAGEDGEWDEVQDTITGSPTTIEFDMPGFVTIPLQVRFVARLFEGRDGTEYWVTK